MTTSKQKAQNAAKKVLTAEGSSKAAKTVKGSSLSSTTEQIKRPTIKSLQTEAANLTEQLVYANKQVLRLEAELKEQLHYVDNLQLTVQDLSNRVEFYKTRYEIMQRTVNTPWYKKVADWWNSTGA